MEGRFLPLLALPLRPTLATGKTVTLAVWAFVSKVMSLLYNMLSRLVIDFLPKSQYL